MLGFCDPKNADWFSISTNKHLQTENILLGLFGSQEIEQD